MSVKKSDIWTVEQLISSSIIAISMPLPHSSHDSRFTTLEIYPTELLDHRVSPQLSKDQLLLTSVVFFRLGICILRQ